MAYNGNLARLSSLCLKNSVILNSDLDAENIMSNLTSCNIIIFLIKKEETFNVNLLHVFCRVIHNKQSCDVYQS